MLPRSHRGDRSRRVLCRQTSKSRSLTSSKLKEENMISYEFFLPIWRGCNHHFWCPTASYPPFYSSKTLLQGLWSKAEIETESISKARSGRLWSKHPLHSQYVRLWLFLAPALKLFCCISMSVSLSCPWALSNESHAFVYLWLDIYEFFVYSHLGLELFVVIFYTFTFLYVSIKLF